MNCLSHFCLLKHFICFWFEASCTYERKLLKLRSWFYISIIFNLLIIPICRLSAQYPSTSTHLALTLHHWQANNSEHTQFYSVALLCLLKLLQIHTQANAHLSATTTATSSRKTVTTACTMHRIAKRKKTNKTCVHYSDYCPLAGVHALAKFQNKQHSLKVLLLVFYVRNALV